MTSPQGLEIVRKAQELYDQRWRAQLEKTHWGSFVSIEPESGEYFLGGTMHEAIASARKAHPQRVSYTLRVGYAVAVEIG
jgi:hypothetical protein